MTLSKNSKFLLTLFFPLCLVACDSKTTDSSSQSSSTNSAKSDSSASNSSIGAAKGNILGAGASFPYPLYSKMFAEYVKETGINVNYQSVGSGTGQKQILERTLDFGASDNAMDDEKINSAPAKIVHLPMALGAVSISYNLPNFSEKLNLSGEVLADIYLGKIQNWNDPAILELNPNTQLPPLAIIPARRSDSSGTTAVFTKFLSSVSAEFLEKTGSANSVSWVSQGSAAKGNDGVAELIKTTPGSIGYVEDAYAVQNQLNIANIRNSAGKFITANTESIEAAASAVPLAEDMRTDIVNASGENSYPISSYTYLLFYPEQNYNNRTEEQAKQLYDLFVWMLDENKGQSYHQSLMYAKLPPNIREKALELVHTMTFDGKSLK